MGQPAYELERCLVWYFYIGCGGFQRLDPGDSLRYHPAVESECSMEPDGVGTEGTVSIMPVRSSSKSQRLCSLATIHI